MAFLCVPSVRPYHRVDYVVLAHFESGNESCDHGGVPVMVHFMRTDMFQKEIIVTTRKTPMLKGADRHFLVPEDAYIVSSEKICYFIQKFLHPSVLTHSAASDDGFNLRAGAVLGTPCPKTFEYFKNVIGVCTIYMAIGDMPYFSSRLRLLLAYCEVEKHNQLDDIANDDKKWKDGDH